jgi:sulfite reductase alpha subunit-like flavoprotein
MAFRGFKCDRRGVVTLRCVQVFGLGNSKTYPERFQAVGIAVDKRISDLGAKRLLERGVGDDNGG